MLTATPFYGNTMGNDMEQRSEEWLAARRGRITASSVGAILGNAPYATRDDVMRRMVREWHGAENEFTGNIATEYGVNNEAGAMIEYQMETGFKVDPVGFITREDWAGCSPDGLIGNEAGLEIKCPFGLRKDEKPVFKLLFEQPHYMDQVQFSLWVTERNAWEFYQWSAFGAMIDGTNVDPDWRVANMPKLRQFYAEYLHERDDPDAIAIHLAPKRHLVDTPEAARMVAEYDQLSDAIENARARKAELLADMVRIAGEKNAVFAGRNLTQTNRVGAVAYAKAIKALLPKADLEPYRGKPSSFWGLK